MPKIIITTPFEMVTALGSLFSVKNPNMFLPLGMKSAYRRKLARNRVDYSKFTRAYGGSVTVSGKNIT